MKLLITGATGFVGSNFINKYKDKYDIQTFSFLNDDINVLDCHGLDVVVHLSALVHQMGGTSKEEYEKVNVTQTLELARKAKESGVKHFIFMSTVKVYGEETSVAYNENSECLPQDEYAKSKLKAERELLKLEDESFRVSIIRTPIVYGYGVKANIKNLINLVSKVSVLPFAGIDNKRSMVYVGNLCYLVNVLIDRSVGLDCRASLAMTEKESFAMTEEASFAMTEGSVFLASDDAAVSTTRLIELIADGLGKKVYLVKIPFFESFLKLVKPSFHKRLYGSLEVDNSLTKQKLNLKNPYSVEDGIKLMLTKGTK